MKLRRWDIGWTLIQILPGSKATPPLNFIRALNWTVNLYNSSQVLCCGCNILIMPTFSFVFKSLVASLKWVTDLFYFLCHLSNMKNSKRKSTYWNLCSILILSSKYRFYIVTSVNEKEVFNSPNNLTYTKMKKIMNHCFLTIGEMTSSPYGKRLRGTTIFFSKFEL